MYLLLVDECIAEEGIQISCLKTFVTRLVVASSITFFASGLKIVSRIGIRRATT